MKVRNTLPRGVVLDTFTCEVLVLLVVRELGRDGFVERERAVQGIERMEAMLWDADGDLLLLDPDCRRIRGKESH